MMKKLFYTVLILCAATLVFSCGDKDEPTPEGGKTDPNPWDGTMSIEDYMKEDRPFVWNGDWNDESDPLNKNPDKSKKYNRLEGTYWKIAVDEVYHYTEDFKEEHYYYNRETNTLKYGNEYSYMINDRGYDVGVGRDIMDYYGYFISTDNIMYINPIPNGHKPLMNFKSLWKKRLAFNPTGITIDKTNKK